MLVHNMWKKIRKNKITLIDTEFICPYCGETLYVKEFEEDDREIVLDTLICKNCEILFYMPDAYLYKRETK